MFSMFKPSNSTLNQTWREENYTQTQEPELWVVATVSVQQESQ